MDVLFFPHAAIMANRAALVLQPSLYTDADAFYAATLSGGAPPPNLIANPGFADTTAWTLETPGWSISGGAAHKANAANSSGKRIYQLTAAAQPVGNYTVTVTASSVVNSGAARAEVGLQQDGGTFPNTVLALVNGANTSTLTTNAEFKLLVFFRASRGTLAENDATTFTIDDVAVRRA